jgi:hypothetical protein
MTKSKKTDVVETAVVKAVEKTEKVEDKVVEKAEEKVVEKENKKEKKVKEKNVKEKKEKKGKKEKNEKKEVIGKRSFQAIYENIDKTIVREGRYCGTKPMQAASKALTAIFKEYSSRDLDYPKVIKFGVIETTRKSKHKKYWYAGKRDKLETPIQAIEIDKVTKEHRPIFVKIKGKDGKPTNKLDEKGNPIPVLYCFKNVVSKVKEAECQNLADLKINPEQLEEEEKVAIEGKVEKKVEEKVEEKVEKKVEEKVEEKKEKKEKKKKEKKEKTEE